MAYQETTGNSPDDVISKIATFANAAGWTVVKNEIVGSNRTLVLQNGGDYVWVWNSDASNIRIAGTVGYDPGLTVTAQAGYSGNYAEANCGVGPYANIFMFADSDPAAHVHVVIEMSGGVFRHISFGTLDKLGAYTGGTYFDASNWTSSEQYTNSWNNRNRALFDCNSLNSARYGGARCDIPVDSRSNAWALLRDGVSYQSFTGLYGGLSEQSSGEGYLMTQFYNRNNPPFSGQVTLGAIRIDVSRPGGFRSPIGVVPNVRYLNMARYSPGQEITVGSDTWKVFPMCRKGSGAQGSPYSQNHAYAYKKVA